MLPIETTRLILKPTDVEDKEFIFELMNTESWKKFIGDRNIQNVSDAENYIRDRMLVQIEAYGYGNNTIFLKEGHIKIGTCGLYRRPGMEGVDIGFAMLPQYESKGYGYESAKAVMKYGMEELGMEFIQAITTEDNLVSQGLIEKLGMAYKETREVEGIEELMRVYRIERAE